MPLVRSLSSVGKKASGKDTELVSTTMEKRDPEVNDEINIPGFIETPPADDTQPEGNPEFFLQRMRFWPRLL